jgi:hypothetical protein
MASKAMQAGVSKGVTEFGFQTTGKSPVLFQRRMDEGVSSGCEGFCLN